ncbi:MAG: methylated-DNA--[protein]-cysteine S-methyltransferase [Thermodesulfovibrio sp.]|nr:methylated-DNA--[protein]-cysteine S-methyltransferase [Thermodesulfovibrio sp.]MCX7724154.1 methylated-DNA--[protein]-cysteine S-methyltransferase [Thermodesulfovibrio sp.]MDW7971828.1 methylated-DNA--[protein]-cysteine S-methyltransferase [Thermodesulfovibrio sp.]
MYFIYVLCPIGWLGVVFDEFFSVKKIFVNKSIKTDKDIKIPDFALDFTNQLNLYFKGELLKFSYPIKLQDISDFDKKVLELTNEIPYGKTVTYNWIAKKLNTSPIAVGQALKRNPLPIVIPCHRVIKSDGSLGGYSLGVEIKKWLIEHERLVASKFR